MERKGNKGQRDRLMRGEEGEEARVLIQLLGAFSSELLPLVKAVVIIIRRQ